MYITFDSLIGFCMFVIALIGLCYKLFKGKKD